MTFAADDHCSRYTYPTGHSGGWGARDPSGVIYLFAEYPFRDTEPGRNAKAIVECGTWIPGVLNLSALQGSQEGKLGEIL